ncbi:MAG: nuclear transport factor 2 family protein [Candidatus Eremiobacteraeota bacterium]|nr:nuclear transport factor 2 family protein [Candidatus Eremiobacteraeota bacterium]
MKRLLASLSLFLAIAMQNSASATQGDDVAQLRALEQAFATAMNHKELDAVMAVYAPGPELFVFDVVGPPSVHSGWAAYREAFRNMFAAIAGPLALTMSDLDIHAGGEVAYSRSLQRVSGTYAKSGKQFDYSVRVTDVYRKIGGQWLIVQEHLSLPLERGPFAPMLHSSITPHAAPS